MGKPGQCVLRHFWHTEILVIVAVPRHNQSRAVLSAHICRLLSFSQKHRNCNFREFRKNSSSIFDKPRQSNLNWALSGRLLRPPSPSDKPPPGPTILSETNVRHPRNSSVEVVDAGCTRNLPLMLPPCGNEVPLTLPISFRVSLLFSRTCTLMLTRARAQLVRSATRVQRNSRTMSVDEWESERETKRKKRKVSDRREKQRVRLREKQKTDKKRGRKHEVSSTEGTT